MLNHRQLFLNHVAQTSQAPVALHIVKASGCFLYDDKGKEYIDLIAGISVCNIGHNHPAVVKAIKEQADDFLHVMVYGELIESPQTKLAHLLSQHLPPSLNCTYFVNSGAEAVEGALKLAKRFTGRKEIVSFKNSYHGSTHGALSLMSDEYFTSAYRPLLPGVTHLEFNNADDLKHITTNTACVITEIVRAEAGCITPENNFFQLLQTRCKEMGTLLIADECQTGLGRTGALFGFEHYQIEPDILCLGKALGGGMPLGAFIASHKMMQSFTVNPVLGHLTTFGGHPVCCAAAFASLNEIMGSKIYEQAEKKEKLFRDLLVHKKIKSIAGKGLLLAVEFEKEDFNRVVIQQCITDGVFTDWFLFAPNKLRLAPPLTISNDLIKRSCEVILNAIDKVSMV